MKIDFHRQNFKSNNLINPDKYLNKFPLLVATWMLLLFCVNAVPAQNNNTAVLSPVIGLLLDDDSTPTSSAPRTFTPTFDSSPSPISHGVPSVYLIVLAAALAAAFAIAAVFSIAGAFVFIFIFAGAAAIAFAIGIF